MVFQKPNPFPMSIYDNIAYGPRTHGIRSKAKLDDLVEKSLRDAAIWNECKDRLKTSALGMSGGQQQRTSIGRAIIKNPDILLCDEPTGALDSRSSRMLLESFNFLNTELLATILMVTHDAFTASYAGRVIFIKDGKIFNEIRRGESTRKEFFDKIIDVVTLLGGDLNNAL